ncbi:MAG TPA: family 43 glycosylhydrolase, partial [Longimicrobiaceae bacterium]|nr:family 43 glycosylhydrolase [Longimicrobiaceae bacterium]
TRHPLPQAGEGTWGHTRTRLFSSVALALALTLGAASAAAQSAGIRTYCNPVDIDYRYNFEQLNQGISYRSGADPVIVPYHGDYYLFETLAAGWWHSKDLGHWEHVDPDKWPFEGIVAPAALAAHDTVFLFQSNFGQRPVLFTTTPWNGHLEFYNRWMPLLPDTMGQPIGPWDPDIFHDPDTDRWFMYFGSSNTYPIYGVELDHAKHLAYAGKPQPLIRLHPEAHGWERFGFDHRDTATTPFIEGAWMTKHGGRYYLQYAAPGTEYNVYANGTYVGDGPLGPFTYAPYNPVSYKPGGFMVGAGHGNTFRDDYGNYWNTGTGWVAVNWNFERRIVMFPAGFDSDGVMFSDTRFGDFPHYLPTSKWQTPDELFTGWMLLSYRKPATASSVRDTFAASNVTDENPRTFWVAGRNRPGETITVDLERPYTVRALQVNFTDYESDIFATDSTVYTRFRVEGSLDGRSWVPMADLSHETRDRPNAYVELPEPVRARYVRYVHGYVASPNLAISDLRVFGNGSGGPPAAPKNLTARRESDARDAVIRWSPVRGAVGYNVRWGIAPDKLYETYQRWADQGDELELRALNVGQDYYFAVEAFDENGVSRLSPVVHVP